VFPAIAQLPEPFRAALVAVDIAGLSYAEAARALGAPEATITTRVYRARQRVAQEFDPERSALRDRTQPLELRPSSRHRGRAERNDGSSTPRQRPAPAAAHTTTRRAD
jgi:hypothetical protein